MKGPNETSKKRKPVNCPKRRKTGVTKSKLVSVVDYEESLLLGEVRRANGKRKKLVKKTDVSVSRSTL